jgi:hypothetical protein
MKRLAAAAAALIALLAASTVRAGEVSDFEGKMRAAYADYRTALFATNSGKAEPSAKAVVAFKSAWAPLAASPPPPQYVDDPAFAETMQAVATIADAAANEIAAGDLPKAHETLEGIREEIAGLHARNGIIGFSDRMNAYHAQMEAVIGMDASDPGAVAAGAAILGYLLADVTANPPAGADASFQELSSAVEASVSRLREATASNDQAAIKAAIGGLKMPYSKLFLKFG